MEILKVSDLVLEDERDATLLLGREVLGLNGEVIGKCESIISNRDNSVKYVVVNNGKFKLKLDARSLLLKDGKIIFIGSSNITTKQIILELARAIIEIIELDSTIENNPFETKNNLHTARTHIIMALKALDIIAGEHTDIL